MKKGGKIGIRGKKAQSAIIVTVLLILMIIVAIVVVWNVVQFTVSKSASEISADVFTTKITVPSTKLYLTGGAQVQVHRGTGTETLTALKFIFQKKTGETNILTINTNLPNEIDTKTYNFNSSQVLFNNSDIAKISVVPVFGTNMGMKTEETSAYSKDSSGNRVLDINPSSGLVSWWKFNGNFNDALGINNGNPQNGVSIVNVSSRGQVAYFDGIDDLITVPDSNSLDLPDKLTISIWIYSKQLPPIAVQVHPIRKMLDTNNANYVLYYFGSSSTYNPPKSLVYIANAGGVWKILSKEPNPIEINQWYHVVWTYDSSKGGLIYMNGVSDGIFIGGGILAINDIPLVIGGLGYPPATLNGTLDDIMIFNLSLSASEVQALYNNQK